MRSVWKCVLGLCAGLAGLGFLAAGAEAQFKNSSQPTELNIPRVSQGGSVTQRIGLMDRSEERRVGKECRSRWEAYNEKKKMKRIKIKKAARIRTNVINQEHRGGKE